MLWEQSRIHIRVSAGHAVARAARACGCLLGTRLSCPVQRKRPLHTRLINQCAPRALARSLSQTLYRNTSLARMPVCAAFQPRSPRARVSCRAMTTPHPRVLAPCSERMRRRDPCPSPAPPDPSTPALPSPRPAGEEHISAAAGNIQRKREREMATGSCLSPPRQLACFQLVPPSGRRLRPRAAQ